MSRVLAVVCFLLVVTGAGCLGLADDELTSEDLLEELNETDAPTVVAGTYHANWTYSNQSFSLSHDSWIRADGASRRENDVDGQTLVTVDDGDRRWRYDPTRNTVAVRDSRTEGNQTSERRDGLAEILRNGPVAGIQETEYQGRAAYHVTLTRSDSGRDRQPLPVLLPGGGIAGGGSGDEQLTDVKTPFNATRVELWIDAASMVVVKQRIEGDETGVFRYENVTFEVSGNPFAFEVPENTTIRTPTDLESRVDSYEAARERVDRVPDPELPERFSFARGSVTDERLSLSYTDGEQNVVVSRSTDTMAWETDGEPVAVGEQTAYRRVNGSATTLVWTCEEYSYRVIGTAAEETLVEAASSVACS